MAIPSGSGDEFSFKTLRKDLARLVEHGIAPFWVMEICERRLFRLRSVHAKLEGGSIPDDPRAAEQALTDAFVAMLREAISEVSSRQFRILLEIVLGYHPDYPVPGTRLRERRIAAGRMFRDGSQTVTWGTIRNYHEVHALDQLAGVIHQFEKAAGGPTPLTA